MKLLWMDFRQEALEKSQQEFALKYDILDLLSVPYGLRVFCLRTKFYKMVSDDPVTAKMLLPALERRLDVPAADNMVEPIEKLDSHMMIQLMKVVATLKVSNEKNKASRKKGGSADGQ